MDLLELEAELDRALKRANEVQATDTERVVHAQPYDCKTRREALQAIDRAADQRRRRAHRKYQQFLEAYKEAHKHEWSRL